MTNIKNRMKRTLWTGIILYYVHNRCFCTKGRNIQRNKIEGGYVPYYEIFNWAADQPLVYRLSLCLS